MQSFPLRIANVNTNDGLVINSEKKSLYAYNFVIIRGSVFIPTAEPLARVCTQAFANPRYFSSLHSLF